MLFGFYMPYDDINRKNTVQRSAYKTASDKLEIEVLSPK